ncbi:MAG: hypothetical protein A2W17_12265 [Planctomycetes bacterium RBG_16_41_13]|nr:MAG: hypothetical protein A2W17_12265 [Planctomycetes bacterium RBG_16_41_13]
MWVMALCIIRSGIESIKRVIHVTNLNPLKVSSKDNFTFLAKYTAEWLNDYMVIWLIDHPIQPLVIL